MKKQQRKGRKGRGRRNVTKRNFNGGITRGSVQPRTVSASPWCHVALTSFTEPAGLSDAKYFCVTFKAVRDQLKVELGLGATTVNMRIVRVSIWTSPTVAGSDSNFIVMSPADLSQAPKDCNVYRQMNWYEAWGTVVRPAHIHYVWPKSQSVRVINEADVGELLLMDLKGGTPLKYIFRFGVQWRCDSPDPRPKDVSPLELYSYRDLALSSPYDLYSEVQEMAC